MSQTNEDLIFHIEDCHRAMRAAREAIAIAQRYVAPEWKRTMINSIEYLNEQLNGMKTFNSGMDKEDYNLPKAEYKMTENKHFEPVTAKYLAKTAFDIVMKSSVPRLSWGATVVNDIAELLDPHLRKSSDDDKSVPKRCESAYNEALMLLKMADDLFSNMSSNRGNSWMEIRREFLKKPNPFKEAEIVDKEEDKQDAFRLLPFDLKAAQEGAKVVTRDGDYAKILCDDLSGPYPITAAVTRGNGDKVALMFTISGASVLNHETKNDLFILKETGTVNVSILRNIHTGLIEATTESEVKNTVYYKSDCELIKTITVTI